MFRKDIDKIIQWLKDGDIQEAYNFFEQYSGPDDINQEYDYAERKTT